MGAFHIAFVRLANDDTRAYVDLGTGGYFFCLYYQPLDLYLREIFLLDHEC